MNTIWYHCFMNVKGKDDARKFNRIDSSNKKWGNIDCGWKVKILFLLVSNGGWPNEIENDQKFSKITQKWSFLTI